LTEFVVHVSFTIHIRYTVNYGFLKLIHVSHQYVIKEYSSSCFSTFHS